MDRSTSQLTRWWRPLAAAGIGIALIGASVAEAGVASGRLTATLRLLAAAALVLAAALTVVAALADRAAEHTEPTGHDGAEAPGADDEMAMALVEVAHERDVSIARASEAEDCARLAGDRLATLAPLEQRLEITERRALDAERRLDEIVERMDAASFTGAPVIDDPARDDPAEDDPAEDDPAEDDPAGDDTAGDDPSDDPEPPAAAARRAAELRARLARTAARKKQSGGDP